MLTDHRQDMRYAASQKAVLVTDGNPGSLCVITNLSNGGLCLALIGSTGPQARGRIDLRVNQGIVPCDIVSRADRRLHCKFETPISDPGLWEALPLTFVNAKDKILYAEQQRKFLKSFIKSIHSKNGIENGETNSSYISYRYSLDRIYIEGCLVGREQIDPFIDTLNTMVNALNPYLAFDERERWRMGFTDAVCHLAKQPNP